jgi:hypothetical protein
MLKKQQKPHKGNMSMFHWLKVGAVAALTIFGIALIAQLLGCWKWVFQPYTAATGNSTN